MKIICKLLQWNNSEQEKLRQEMLESMKRVEQHAEDFSKTVILKVEELRGTSQTPRG